MGKRAQRAVRKANRSATSATVIPRNAPRDVMDDRPIPRYWIEDPDPPDYMTREQWLRFVENLALMFPELVMKDD